MAPEDRDRIAIYACIGLAASLMIYYLVTLGVISHNYKEKDGLVHKERFGQLTDNMKLEN